MNEKKELSLEQLEKINGGANLTPQEILALIEQVKSSTQLDIEFLCQVLIIARKDKYLYAGLYSAVTVRLQILGYEIRVDGVYLGEVLIQKIN